MSVTELDKIAKQVIKDKVRIIVEITPNENGMVTQHIEVEPWEPFQMKCPYKDYADLERAENARCSDN